MHFPPHRLTLVFLLAALVPAFGARELVVDGSAATHGKGSPEAPYKTIGEAIKSAEGEAANITVKAGVYRESITLKQGGAKGDPMIVRAAPGERVEITGFDPVTGWKMEGNLAAVVVTEPVRDLFLGATRERLARFPDATTPWTKITAVDDAGQKVTLDAVPAELKPGEEKSLCFVLLSSAINGQSDHNVTSLDLSGKTIGYTFSKWAKPAVGDPALLFNAISFIKRPGEWACQALDDGTYKVAYWPRDPKDLERLQTRKRDVVVGLPGGKGAVVGPVTLEGLEITGGISQGVKINYGNGTTISKCVIYANGQGVFSDHATGLKVDSCVMFGNGAGICILQGDGNAIQGCEVAINDGDGVNIVGRKPTPEDPITNSTLANTYMHGHIYLGHPDNTQVWGHLKTLEYKNNLALIAGQNLMTEEAEGIKCVDSVMFTALARHVILGHENSNVDDFQNMTFLFGNFGSIGMGKTTTGVTIAKNVFYGNGLNFAGVEPKSADNLFWSPTGTDHLLVTFFNNKFKPHKTVEDINAAAGLEAGSKMADPQFKNIPQGQYISDDMTKSTPDTLYFRKEEALAGLAEGDNIELNGDGVLRKVAALGGGFIKIDPPLEAAPFREVLVWNWGKRTDFQIDLSSPIAGGKDQPGAAINVAAYQRGELDGSGKRSLPDLSAQAKAAWPNPSNFVYPYVIPKAAPAAGAKPDAAAAPAGS